ncbi:hypothetical protein N7468_006703 [Penicillium chermesinum]|uniref:Uncharacterized protein n=1 Tax=Penicillium chermesinum TaxID=63820 RepID=A0A9W9NT31_9EURO|nr:uncharacterized protein N7468_006703 [Penicillium chermesinum]KAJ5225478.1 hypothetical protein N7468_006703 [Penicillium chermesinum]
MSMSNSPPGNGASRPTWQDQLSGKPLAQVSGHRSQEEGEERGLTCEEHCRRTKLAPPVFNIVSDRRGGRTAWSSTVTVQGQNIAARYWYDGQYINNAKEDAAEVALKILNQQPRASTVYVGQMYPQSSSPGYSRGTGL